MRIFMLAVLFFVSMVANAAGDSKSAIFASYDACAEAVVNNDAPVYQPRVLTHKADNVPNGHSIISFETPTKACAQMLVVGDKMAWVYLVRGSTLRCSSKDGKNCDRQHFWDDRCGNHIASIKDVKDPERRVAQEPLPVEPETFHPVESSHPVAQPPQAQMQYASYTIEGDREEPRHRHRESGGHSQLLDILAIGAVAWIDRPRGTHVTVKGNCNFSPYSCNQQPSVGGNYYPHQRHPRYYPPSNPIPSYPNAPTYTPPSGPIGGPSTVGVPPYTQPGGPVYGGGNSGNPGYYPPGSPIPGSGSNPIGYMPPGSGYSPPGGPNQGSGYTPPGSGYSPPGPPVCNGPGC